MPQLALAVESNERERVAFLRRIGDFEPAGEPAVQRVVQIDARARRRTESGERVACLPINEEGLAYGSVRLERSRQ